MSDPTALLPRPGIEQPGPWTFPTPSEHQLDNGLRVIVYDLPGQHVIAGNLVLPIPLDVEPRESEGVAAICARTLDEGSQRHDGETFAELLESEGAGLGIDVALSGTQVILDVPSTRLDPALDLMAEAVIMPALSAGDVNRHVALRLAEIDQAWASSSQAAGIVFRRLVFTQASRASRMRDGEPETVAGVDRDQVVAFHQRYYGPNGATLILAGDFAGAGDPVALAERHFGSWSVPDHALLTPQAAEPGARAGVIFDRPGSVQADLRFGGFGIDRHDPRWAAAVVGCYAMGGAFLSRLNKVLREERGYTYGVRLNLAPLHRGGTFTVQGSFRTEVMGEALVEAKRLLDVSDEPFGAEEVTEAITFFTGVSPLRYATADGVADQAASQLLAGLPRDYVDENLEALRAVTPESATEAYASLIDVDAMSLVLAGDADRLSEPLAQAGYRDLSVVTRP